MGTEHGRLDPTQATTATLGECEAARGWVDGCEPRMKRSRSSSAPQAPGCAGRSRMRAGPTPIRRMDGRLATATRSSGESHVLHGMTFNVPAGEVVTLLGRNGAGKTTTMRAVMGLLSKRTRTVRF